MPWREGNIVALVVRTDEHLRAAIEEHQAWLELRRARTTDTVSLAEAARDLLARGLGTLRRYRGRATPSQLGLFEQSHETDDTKA